MRTCRPLSSTASRGKGRTPWSERAWLDTVRLYVPVLNAAGPVSFEGDGAVTPVLIVDACRSGSVQTTQMAPLLVPGPVVLLVIWLVVSDRRRRRTLLRRFRSEWGRVSTQERDLAAVALYHRTMPAGTTGDELDERTASDLDLDAVFEKLDRTETRVTADKTERHRIQFSLTRLRGHSGDLWWLAQPGVLEPKPWDVVFPLLPPVVPLALALATVWPHRPPAW